MKPLFVFALALLAGAPQSAQQRPPATGAPKDFVLPAATTSRIAAFGTCPKGTIVTGRPLASVKRFAAGSTKSFGAPVAGGFC